MNAREKRIADLILLGLARAGLGWAGARARAAGKNETPEPSISAPGTDDPPQRAAPLPPCVQELCEVYENTFALNLISHVASLGTLDRSEYGIRMHAIHSGDPLTLVAPRNPLPALAQAAPGPISDGSSRGTGWDRRGGSVWLDREEWGVVLDALIREAAHAAQRKAGNPASTSDVRADLCNAIIGKINASDNLGYRVGDEHEPDARSGTSGAGDSKRGLYAKYRVERTDGSSATGRKHEHCDYFVLDLVHDAHARAAINAYADSCHEQYPALAADLWERARSMGADAPAVAAEAAPRMKPSDFRKARGSEFGRNDAADALAYSFASHIGLAGTGKFGDPLRIHHEHIDTKPATEPCDDDGPLMIACDSEYRRGEPGDEHDWCNRTFVARIGNHIVASLNVQGYDDDAFDVVRAAAAAWETPHKSWGPHKIDDLLKVGNDDVTPFIIVVNLLRDAFNMATAGDIDEKTDDGIGWGAWYRDVKDTLGRLSTVPEIDSHIGTPRVHVQVRPKTEYVTKESHDDLRQYAIEVFHDALAWLNGKRDRVPEPDYGERIAGAKLELNSALAAMGNPGTKEFLFSSLRDRALSAIRTCELIGCTFVPGMPFWQKPDHLLPITQAQDAIRYAGLRRAARSIGQADYGQEIVISFNRGPDKEHKTVNYADTPKTLDEFADQLNAP